MAMVYQKSKMLTDAPLHYCPGCTHGIIHKLVAESLEELKDMMEDDRAVAELFREMDVPEIESLLQRAMVYADLEGRKLEDG